MQLRGGLNNKALSLSHKLLFLIARLEVRLPRNETNYRIYSIFPVGYIFTCFSGKPLSVTQFFKLITLNDCKRRVPLLQLQSDLPRDIVIFSVF